MALTEFDVFIERFPEFAPLGAQNRVQVEAKLREARRCFPCLNESQVDLVFLKAAALIAESPVGRSAALTTEKRPMSTYSARLEDELRILACGDRFQ